jgi:hypothetical protein
MYSDYVFAKYTFPNPNDGDNYRFTLKELVELLDKVYDSGFKHARDIYDPARQPILTVAAQYENMDDSTRWKEIQMN